ncbi:23S rRNA (adenine(2503)-C(2))-methyltransferase RlmN [Hippea maritima]|uniref:Probable dual-specificity RNA methyltransferase RlmN n=1 Tax=Hippea maritima (strain ATCC 700847 / DSM 10411 / MH2) TaxID=760142 RepID=F2LTL1_HIPMA|nr:23S rRNA (adenine(2503)-C(2))-methyltransferase RlmN [Hippea maritima]AEA33336.1 Ribosomal RNA large subunit methyltransferase N [Hippea maritima DSM 10411]
MIDIMSLEYDELKSILIGLGYEKYRAEQIFSFLYKQRIEGFDDITVLKKEVRRQLKEQFFIYKIEEKTSYAADDGTKKYLFKLNDGMLIESVLIPMEANRFTICVSTQAGCRMGCKFCATGRMGFKRNLSTSEIVSQVVYILKVNNLKTANVVYMGMGEPLDNYENTVKSIKILSDDRGLSISKRRITLSTAGITPGVNKLKKDLPNINMALSLHSIISKKRSMIMPINDTYPIDEVLNELKDFPMPRRKRITFEYVMIKGINDTKDDLKALLKVMSNFKCKLNIIPLNKHDLLGTKFEPTPMDRIEEFADYLRNKGMFVTIRKSKGSSINAACGMLATKAS